MDVLIDKAFDGIVSGFKKGVQMAQFEQIFLNAAKSMYKEGNTADELDQKLQYVFSEANTRTLIDKLESYAPTDWYMLICTHISILCKNNEIEDKEIDKYVQKYWDIVTTKLYKAFPGEYDSIPIHETRLAVAHLTDTTVGGIADISNQINQVRSITTQIVELLQEQPEPIEKRITVGPIAVNDTPDEWDICTQKTKDLWELIEGNEQELTELTAIWKKERENYPGWYIIPYKYYVKIQNNTKLGGLLKSYKKLDINIVMDFAYEYCWRWNTGMFIISAYEIQDLLGAWYAYFDYMQTPGFTEIPSEQKKIDKWLFIGLCLARDYREILDFDEWHSIYQRLEIGVSNLDEQNLKDFSQLLWLEKVRMFMYKMNLSAVLYEINTYKAEELPYPLQLQIAGILADCGKRDEAIDRLQLLEKNLEQKVADDHFESKERTLCYSLLSCAYQLHKCIFGSEIAFSREYGKNSGLKVLEDKIDRFKEYYSLDENIKSVEVDILRWRYQVDKSHKPVFDVNKKEVVLTGGSQSICHSAYYMYRSLENMAMPIEICNVYWIPREFTYYMNLALFQYCPMLALYMLLRGDNKNFIESNINHMFIIKSSPNDIYKMIDYLVQVVRYNVYEFENHTTWYKQDLYTYALFNTVELLKRLTAYCASYQYNDLMKILIELLKTNCLREFRKIDELVYCIASCVSEKKKAEYLNDFVKLPIVERYIHGKEHQIEVMSMLNHNENTRMFFERARIEADAVDDLLNRYCLDEFEHRMVIERLMMLHEFGKLNESQEVDFATMLWKNVSEEKPLPELPNRYMFVLLSLPHPEGIDVIKRIKENLLNSDWIQQIDQNGYSMLMGNVVFFHEVIGLCKFCKGNNIVCWTKDEAIILINSLLNYMKIKKEKLNLEKGTEWSISDEFVKRFEKIQEVIVEVLGTTDAIDLELKQNIYAVYKEIYGNSIAWIYLRTVLKLDDEQSLMRVVLDSLYCGEDMTMSLKVTEYILINHAFEDEQMHDFLLQVLRIIRVGREKGLASLLIILHNLFYSNTIEFDESELYEIDGVLVSVSSQYQYKQCTSEEMAKQYILVRMCCAKLAYEVHNYTSKHNTSELIGVEIWKSICEGEEFAEVKNAWLE